MNSANNKIITILAGLLISQLTWAHARLKPNGLLVPRSNNAGLKMGPCGGLPRGTSPVTLVAGSIILIEWEETVQHPGRYEFSISAANDTAFSKLLVVPDTQDDPATIPHQYQASFTVPNIVCDRCTFQMIQVMTENPAFPSNYYSCADIKIVAGATPPGNLPPGLPPAPIPSVPDDTKSNCHSE